MTANSTVATGVSSLPAHLAAEVDDLLQRFPPGIVPDRELRAARFAAGLALVHFRTGDGGRDLDPVLQGPVEARFLEGGAVDWAERNILGLGMAAPTIHEHGTEEQCRRLLEPLFTGDEIWCQLFSEPGAGSDLASVATSAQRDGDEWVINGQKVWTTLGHVARWGLLVARSDPTAPKHKGLTYFCVDMTLPGVEVRPLRQMTGDAEFNEVYLTDVRIPDADRLGGVGEGWRVAMTTLMNERVSIGEQVGERGEGPIAWAVGAYRDRSRVFGVDGARRDQLMQLWVRAELARLTNLRAVSAREGAPGPEGSVAKLQMAELNQAIFELCVDLLGSHGALVRTYEMVRPDHAATGGSDDLPKSFLRSRANSIEGGTSEVLRNVLAERVLGLPAEPRVDKDIPWAEVARS
jgi:alkylation response protein AidB-like acyl-CoA dehydrogenase